MFQVLCAKLFLSVSTKEVITWLTNTSRRKFRCRLQPQLTHLELFAPLRGVRVFVRCTFDLENASAPALHRCKHSHTLVALHTGSSLTVPPETEPNERISIWLQWILNCARTDGWIRRDGAPFQQDLHCDSECLRRGLCGVGLGGAGGARGGRCDAATSLQLPGKALWCHYISS